MNIILNGEKRTYEGGTTLFEISKDVAGNYAHPIIVASVNGNLRELTKTAPDGATVEFLIFLLLYHTLHCDFIARIM